MYELDLVETVVKLQTRCNVAYDAVYLWASSDACCIDQNNNVKSCSFDIATKKSPSSACRIFSLPSPKSGVLAKQHWERSRDCSRVFRSTGTSLSFTKQIRPYISAFARATTNNHQELEHVTSTDARFLVMKVIGTREKLQWASSRITTLQEDIAYSLFGIFDIHLPVIYGERKQNTLLREVMAKSADILDWAGQSSNFNSCQPIFFIQSFAVQAANSF